MSAKLGRNDPCHCGSGKKYKKCHWAEDEKRHAVEVIAARKEEEVERIDPRSMAEVIRELPKSLEGEMRRQMEENVAKSATLLEFIENSSEIEAAAAELEKHIGEYDKLLENEDAFSERAQALMDEPPFSELRFTPNEILEALEEVGAPDLRKAADDILEEMEPAILHLASAWRRNEIGAKMLLELPRLLREGRFVEGIMIHVFASDVLDLTGESTSVLRCMFFRGMDEIAEEDPILAEPLDDEFRAEAERWYSLIAGQPKGSRLLLNGEEVSPYYAEFEEAFREHLESSPTSAEENLSEEDNVRLIDKLLKVSTDIAGKIFDEARLDKFKTDAREVALQEEREGKLVDAKTIRYLLALLEDRFELALNTHLAVLTLFSLKCLATGSDFSQS